MTAPNALLARAAEVIAAADALVITAGAGMGVDSGLPDFRGTEGFWRAYPPFRALGLSFEALANPRWFATDPALAWGFYGHRLMLYRATTPHAGFSVLRRLAARMRAGEFVFTSNVDDAFARAGFDADRIVECHGSLSALQCTRDCGAPLWSAKDVVVDVDAETLRARAPLPCCPACGALARPNVLMFGDGGWDPSRTEAQEARLRAWLGDLGAGVRLVIVECGAGTAVPTVRTFSERLARRAGGCLVRVNLREPDVPTGHVGLALGARAGLEAIESRLPVH